MSQPSLALSDEPRRSVRPEHIQFYSIELSPTADGQLAVGILATICEEEGELEGMDLGFRRVSSIDDALAVIRQAITPAH